jgi:hypothetical protein
MRKIKELKERVGNLERSMQQLADDFGREREALKSTAQRHREDFEAEKSALLRHLKYAVTPSPPSTPIRIQFRRKHKQSESTCSIMIGLRKGLHLCCVTSGTGSHLLAVIVSQEGFAPVARSHGWPFSVRAPFGPCVWLTGDGNGEQVDHTRAEKCTSAG